MKYCCVYLGGMWQVMHTSNPYMFSFDMEKHAALEVSLRSDWVSNLHDAPERTRTLRRLQVWTEIKNIMEERGMEL